MKEVKFKVGQPVYCPYISSQILQIKELPSDITVTDITQSTSRNDYGVVKDVLWQKVICLKDGRCMKTHLQAVCHATQENHELLSKLYPNVEFEPPPKRKEPKEIIRAMLDYGYHGVPCKTECGRDKYICTGIVEGEFYPFQYDNDEDNAYSSGIPYHPKTGLKIVDFIDGKCILENGEVVLE